MFNVLDFSLIDGGSSFHADEGSWVVTESDLGCHGHGTAWFVCDVASPVSREGVGGGGGRCYHENPVSSFHMTGPFIVVNNSDFHFNVPVRRLP